MIDSSSGERTSSFQSPTIIAIIPISNEGETALHSHLKDNPYITPTDICNFLLYHGNMKETAVLSTALGGYIFYSAETHTATFVHDMNDRKK